MDESTRVTALTNLPRVFRITQITPAPTRDVPTRIAATLFHAKTELDVTWVATPSEKLPQEGALVSIRFPLSIGRVDGDLQARRLVTLERPVSGTDLFKTVPSSWVSDHALLERASALWQRLGSPWRELFNRVLWDGERFRSFCEGPGSIQGHHSVRNGNLRHTVETAEAALALLPQHPAAHPDVVLIAALLHDVGKAVEYEATRCGWTLSDRGKLIGHKLTALGWIAVAESRMSEKLSSDESMALSHAIGAASNVTFESGYRTGRTPEAKVLSLADQSSGTGDLYAKNCCPNGGWGQEHPHLGRQSPYSLGKVSTRTGDRNPRQKQDS